MAGYAVMARIASSAPRRAGSDWGAPNGEGAPPPGRVTADVEADRLDIEPSTMEPSRRDDRVTERWASIQVGWAQTTFFLFDPDSWRR